MSYTARRWGWKFGFTFIFSPITLTMFKKILIQFALRLLKSQLLDKINYAPLTAFLNPTYSRLQKVADIVTDSNPQDGEQLKELWEAEKGRFISDTLDSAIAVIRQEVKNEELAEIVIDLLETIQREQESLS